MTSGLARTMTVAAVLALGALASPATAAATPGAATAPTTAGAPISVNAATGTDGPCPTADGVTVVVDFHSLGRDTIVRCAPGSPNSGFDALAAAGISFTQVSSNPGFMCKIEGLPAPEGYASGCSAIPPTSAYWGYWVAARGQAWCYSSVGASRTPPPGTVEGWSFASGKSEAGAPPPRVAPPAHVSGAPTSVSKASCPSAPTTSTSTTSAPPVTADAQRSDAPTTAAPSSATGSGGPANPGPGAPSSGSPSPSSGSDPDASTAEGSLDPASTPTLADDSPGDDEAAGDSSLIRADTTDSGSPVGVALGLGGVVVVGATALVTARRRSRSATP